MEDEKDKMSEDNREKAKPAKQSNGNASSGKYHQVKSKRGAFVTTYRDIPPEIREKFRLCSRSKT